MMNSTDKKMIREFLDLDDQLQDALETLERLSELTPERANAKDARALHHTVKAIALCCIDRLKEKGV